MINLSVRVIFAKNFTRLSIFIAKNTGNYSFLGYRDWTPWKCFLVFTFTFVGLQIVNLLLLMLWQTEVSVLLFGGVSMVGPSTETDCDGSGNLRAVTMAVQPVCETHCELA